MNRVRLRASFRGRIHAKPRVIRGAHKHTPHGWRAAFSTLAKEHDYARDVVEIALHHVHDNAVVLAYDRGERLEQRRKLNDWWSSKLQEAYS